jgi:hypothetical protein
LLVSGGEFVTLENLDTVFAKNKILSLLSSWKTRVVIISHMFHKFINKQAKGESKNDKN